LFDPEREEGLGQEVPTRYCTPTPTFHVDHDGCNHDDVNANTIDLFSMQQQQHGHLHNYQPGGGFVTTGMVAVIGILAGYMLDSHPYTKRFVPLVQHGVERFQRSHQQLHQPEVLLYDDPSGHRQVSPPFPQELTNSLSQALCQCPLSGGSLNIHFPPNTAYALVFVAFSLALHVIIHRLSILRPRRDLNCLLQLQDQLQSQTTSVSAAARHCKTSEKAIRDWLHSFETFANGPASPGPDHS
jgi:hypothetical protein